MALEFLDTVRVARLDAAEREASGSESVFRQPRVGDIGTVVEVLAGEYLVECVDSAGRTVWLAAFTDGELALDTRRPDRPFVA